MDAFGALPPAVDFTGTGASSQANSAALIDALSECECPALTMRRARRAELAGASYDPIVWQRALGSNVVDVDGNRYVDLTAGFGAASIGHCHPTLTRAVQAQAATLLQALGDVHPSDVKIKLLQALKQRAPFADARVMLSLSGSEAVEGALKTAKLFTGKPGVMAFKGAYHGLAHGPLAACGYQEAFRAPFADQLNAHVVFAPYLAAHTSPTPEALSDMLGQIERLWDQFSETLGAVIVEPMLGRGGVVLPAPGFLQAIGELAHARGALVIADEVYTGLGRAGALWYSLEHNLSADILCVGKALGGGLPVSACIASQRVMHAWGDPDKEALHTGTFYGNPLGSAAALATLTVIDDEKLIARTDRVGQSFKTALVQRLAPFSFVKNVRGAGLMIGVEFDRGERALALARQLLERGYLTLNAGKKAEVISLSPPLTIAEQLLDGFVSTLEDLCRAQQS